MSTSTTIYPSADANLRENAADTNYGGNVAMRAGDYTTYRRHAVFMFDVSAITAIADIVSATISFTYSGRSMSEGPLGCSMLDGSEGNSDIMLESSRDHSNVDWDIPTKKGTE